MLLLYFLQQISGNHSCQFFTVNLMEIYKLLIIIDLRQHLLKLLLHWDYF